MHVRLKLKASLRAGTMKTILTKISTFHTYTRGGRCIELLPLQQSQPSGCHEMFTHTSGRPQSHISPRSTIPFPHLGSATVDWGSLPRQLSRSSVVNPSFRSLRLQLLHWEGAGRPRIWMAAMMQSNSGSPQSQLPVMYISSTCHVDTKYSIATWGIDYISYNYRGSLWK